jgi:hypothetical protein
MYWTSECSQFNVEDLKIPLVVLTTTRVVVATANLVTATALLCIWKNKRRSLKITIKSRGTRRSAIKKEKYHDPSSGSSSFLSHEKQIGY